MEVSSATQPPYTDDWEYEEDNNDDYFENNSGEGEKIVFLASIEFPPLKPI